MTTKKTEPLTTLTTFERLAQVQQGVTCKKGLTGSTGKYDYSYRNVAGIIEAAKPHLKKARAAITISAEPRLIGSHVYVHATAVFHNVDTGETISSSACARENLGNMKMDPSQATGSATTYARKYAMEGLLLLDEAEHDPDGRVYEPPEQVAAPAAVKVAPAVVAEHVKTLAAALMAEKLGGNSGIVVNAIDRIPVEQHKAVWAALDADSKKAIKNAQAHYKNLEIAENAHSIY
jgi:hypothetical protein